MRVSRTSSCGRWCWYSAQAMAARAQAWPASARPPSASRPRRAAASASSRARAFTRPSRPSTAVALRACKTPRAARAWCWPCRSRAADQARTMRPPRSLGAEAQCSALHGACRVALDIAYASRAAPRHRRTSSGGARGEGARALASCSGLSETLAAPHASGAKSQAATRTSTTASPTSTTRSLGAPAPRSAWRPRPGSATTAQRRRACGHRCV